MSRLSVPPSTRPLTTSSESTTKSKARSPSPIIERGAVNGKVYDLNPPIPKQFISARSPSPSPAPEERGANESEAGDSDVIDQDTFDQILELDEDDTYEFSSEMVVEYFAQAKTTFKDMEEALDEKDCAKLSSLGHFLKGSSAALGVSKVQSSCEKIQHYGKLRDEEAGKDLDEATALKLTKELLVAVKEEYAEAERWLRDWYAKKKVPLPKP